MIPHVVKVTGIPGSGKSYICKSLSYIKCIDTDQILADTYNHLIKTSPKFKKTLTISNKQDPSLLPSALAKILFSTAKQRLRDHINNLKVKFVIVVGITVECKADESFFIAIKPSELPKMYRRVLQREMDKIHKNYSQICKSIKTQPINEIATKLHFNLEIGALDVCTTFAGYQQIYRDALKYEKKKKTKILNQAQIISKIKALHKKYQ